MTRLVVALTFIAFTTHATLAYDKAESDSAPKHPIYGLKMKSLTGKTLELEKFRGKVLLIVNTASECGATPQYDTLQKLHKALEDKGLAVMGFPCNQFGSQEPGSNKDIATFCKKNYGVEFTMFGKVDVNGEKAAPLFKYLTSEKSGLKKTGPIQWNFEKFIVSRTGEVVARFDTGVEPDSNEVLDTLVAELKKDAPERKQPAGKAATRLNELTEAEKRSGWELLFDGKSTGGWRNFKKDGVSDKWVIEDGVLTLTGRGGGDIITDGQYDMFELQLEFRISKGGNSGIMFHVTEEESTPWRTGPEVQLQDNVDGHDPQKAGWLYQLYKPKKPAWAKRFEAQVGFKGIEMDDATRPVGEWNHVYLRVHPQQSEVQVNGVHYYYFVKGSDDWNARVAKSKFASMPRFGKPEKGHICLQDHGNVISFRNIKIRKLPADGKAPNPVDEMLPLKPELAFPDLKLEGWKPVSDEGLPQPLRPIEMIHAGDESNRLFVAMQGGRIWHFPADASAKKATLFLDIRKRVHQWKVDDEEGLLGFAIHPKFKENGQFFVCYNNEVKDRQMYLSRFTVSKGDPNRADPDSEEVLLTIQQPFSNHNGGPMAFGHDGYLYIGMGDGGGRNDPTGQGQAKDSFMGTVLRIDVDHKDEGKAYAVPKDNPFVGTEGVPGEIFATGIRNTWRISFDQKTGSCWMADVGQDWLEEVNIITRGGNYGWSAREGTHVFGNADEPAGLKVVEPVWEYDHRIGKSITGGYVYRGSRLPELDGHYLYGDYITGLLWGLKYDEKAGKVVRNVGIPWGGENIIAFGQDEAGEVYVMTPTVNGKFIYRLSREQ